ncbi:SPOR domain-containing protein [Spongiibacter tropicus]|uniref:SPOR domain-containing protein n=1 Tax=Spongiibacter tropicus TaxID=454602 RepID=UPI0024E27083|nr:SPOR domain-containing protein [Spongiibacter tropicus]
MMRQRLVGTLVLLCGGVILWSLLFTGPAEYKLDRSSQIPPQPRIETPQESEPRIPEGIASASAPIVEPQPVIVPASEEMPSRFNGEGVKAAATPPEREPRAVSQPEVTAPKRVSKPEPQTAAAAPEKAKTAAPPVEPSAEARGLPVAWVIQCGSFGQQANAEKLAKRLRDGGYKAYTETLKRSSGTLYRVLVGPALNRERAESLQAEINRRFELKSILSRFEG